VRGLGPFGEAVGFSHPHHEAQIHQIEMNRHGGIVPVG
jgi:hypothetical protein